MNSDVEIRASAIVGLGIFAKRDFKKGETVLEWDTSHVIDDKASVSPEEQDFLARFQGKWIIMQEPMRFMNHSCEPNTSAHAGTDVALRDIGAGEEITTDYRPEMQQGDRMECLCGSSSCKGYIIGTGI